MNTLSKYLIFTSFLLASCSSDDKKHTQITQKAEYIYRVHNEHHFPLEPLKIQKQKPYPWEIGNNGNYPLVTKEYFRCKGSSLNPPRHYQDKTASQTIYDCGGSEKHSLVLRDREEFIYPILIDLLNYLQTKTGKRVVITCGHRCPDHNTYSDPTPENQYSKHMIGAEVSFYVQGMEENPEEIVELIKMYYQSNAFYAGKKDYLEFKPYEKDDTNVSTPPIYNKEIFVKLFKKKEGRNFDNRHPYPYISIQVRFDKDKNERVVYSWKEANQNFLRK